MVLEGEVQSGVETVSERSTRPQTKTLHMGTLNVDVSKLNECVEGALDKGSDNRVTVKRTYREREWKRVNNPSRMR